MKLSDLAALPFTYREVGATAGPLPAGYHHVCKSAVIGDGRRRFEDAAAAVMRWGMLRGAGVRVEASTEVAEVGSDVIVGIGPIPRRAGWSTSSTNPIGAGSPTARCRVIAESGEELFAVRYDPATGEVYAEVTAFSRHATWWSRLGAPVTSLAQRVITNRYLKAL